MKSIYWKIRGIANPPLRLALKRLLVIHKPQFIFIAEPKFVFDNLPISWFSKLGFKHFARNSSPFHSLWCLCRLDLDPTVLESKEQFVAFSFYQDNNPLALVVVYASNNLYKLKEL